MELQVKPKHSLFRIKKKKTTKRSPLVLQRAVSMNCKVFSPYQWQALGYDLLSKWTFLLTLLNSIHVLRVQ